MLADPVILPSGCKINLFLRVGPLRADGKHDLHTFFLPLAEPGDSIRVRPVPAASEKPPTVVFTDASGRALADIDPERNTLVKAWQWYAAQTGFAPALRIEVTKTVPHGAGLGGGSANAAALLLFLQKLAAASGAPPLPDADMATGSAAVGADVPFFLLGRPALAAGVGERLAPAANPFAGHWLLLLCPEIQISTAWAFAELDRLRAKRPPAPLAEYAALPPCPHDYANDFESLVFSRHPSLAALHAALKDTGPVLARLSGTGSTLFALYRDEENAFKAAKALASRVLSVYRQRLPG